MSKAIKITLKKAEENYDLLASKLFGAPVFPLEWKDKYTEFMDDIVFFGQIRLSDIAHLDTENRLPHTGYLYFILDTELFPYTGWAEYYDGEPKLVIDDFNEITRFRHLNQAFLMSFEEADEDYDGNKLFGVPSSSPDEDSKLLLQFDPLDVPTGFLEEIDGYAYFFFGEDDSKLDEVRFVVDRS